MVDAADDPAARPPEGSHCLKAGYWPISGETFPFPPEGIPGTVKHFTLSSARLNLDQNKTYQLSFKVKNSGMRDLHYSFTRPLHRGAEHGKDRTWRTRRAEKS